MSVSFRLINKTDLQPGDWVDLTPAELSQRNGCEYWFRVIARTDSLSEIGQCFLVRISTLSLYMFNPQESSISRTYLSQADFAPVSPTSKLPLGLEKIRTLEQNHLSTSIPKEKLRKFNAAVGTLIEQMKEANLYRQFPLRVISEPEEYVSSSLPPCALRERSSSSLTSERSRHSYLRNKLNPPR